MPRRPFARKNSEDDSRLALQYYSPRRSRVRAPCCLRLVAYGYIRSLPNQGARGTPGFMFDANRSKFDLPALISECDANYIRLRRLLPDLDSRNDWQFVLPIGDEEFTVNCEIVERSKYTCLLRIWQRSFFSGDGVRQFGAPNLLVRVYLDTNSAEVIEMQRQRGFRPLVQPRRQSGQAAFEKLHVNRFLGEYLSFCVRHGAVSNESLPAA